MNEVFHRFDKILGSSQHPGSVGLGSATVLFAGDFTN
jgi:hypothetical protein